MSENWIVENLNGALETWNSHLEELWLLLTTSPEDFKGGSIWQIIVNINGALKAVGYALLVLFFVMGIIKSCASFAELKKPEMVLKLFVRFAISKALITYGLDLMIKLLAIVQGITGNIMSASGLSLLGASKLPEELIGSIENTGFLESIPLWTVTLLGSLFITVLSYVMILTVYGRFFKLYMYTAISPVPLSTFAGEPTQNTGKSFLKSYIGVLLEGSVIVLACIIFSVFASSPPQVHESVSTVTKVWSYVGEVIFNMLVLVGSVKASDRIVREMFMS